jgi:hypothetical protein
MKAPFRSTASRTHSVLWNSLRYCSLITDHFLFPFTRGRYPRVMTPFFHSESPVLVFLMAYQRGTPPEADKAGPLRIPLGKLGAAASPTDKPRKYGALPPVIPKRHHYTPDPIRSPTGLFGAPFHGASPYFLALKKVSLTPDLYPRGVFTVYRLPFTVH